PATQRAAADPTLVASLVSELVDNLELQLDTSLGILLDPLLGSAILPQLDSALLNQLPLDLNLMLADLIDPALANLGLGPGGLEASVL
ncbi:MAG TPA: hypothetical protein PKE45_15475, partial [Caldilineaceae bacterium]|nr:hypothetical protein [Caldilineaceae bacterium]